MKKAHKNIDLDTTLALRAKSGGDTLIDRGWAWHIKIPTVVIIFVIAIAATAMITAFCAGRRERMKRRIERKLAKRRELPTP